jgi:hypothetical protein
MYSNMGFWRRKVTWDVINKQIENSIALIKYIMFILVGPFLLTDEANVSFILTTHISLIFSLFN